MHCGHQWISVIKTSQVHVLLEKGTGLSDSGHLVDDMEAHIPFPGLSLFPCLFVSLSPYLSSFLASKMGVNLLSPMLPECYLFCLGANVDLSPFIRHCCHLFPDAMCHPRQIIFLVLY